MIRVSRLHLPSWDATTHSVDNAKLDDITRYVAKGTTLALIIVDYSP
nr:pheromone [Rhizopogon roseolus]